MIDCVSTLHDRRMTHHSRRSCAFQFVAHTSARVMQKTDNQVIGGDIPGLSVRQSG
jgi:hypothetical protein